MEELKKQIAELERRWPAHSAPPAMLQQLDELEEELERELRKGAGEKDRVQANVGFTAQVSPYPIPEFASARDLQVLRECAVGVDPEAVSNLLVGDDTTIFFALQQAFCHAAERGKVVMVATLFNACPVLGE
jgi:hypothetical protein